MVKNELSIVSSCVEAQAQGKFYICYRI